MRRRGRSAPHGRRTRVGTGGPPPGRRGRLRPAWRRRRRPRRPSTRSPSPAGRCRSARSRRAAWRGTAGRAGARGGSATNCSGVLLVEEHADRVRRPEDVVTVGAGPRGRRRGTSGSPRPAASRCAPGTSSPTVRTTPTTVEANGSDPSSRSLIQTCEPGSMPSAAAEPSLTSSSSGASASRAGGRRRRPARPTTSARSAPSTWIIVRRPARPVDARGDQHHRPRRPAPPGARPASSGSAPTRPTGRTHCTPRARPESPARRPRGRSRSSTSGGSDGSTNWSMA